MYNMKCFLNCLRLPSNWQQFRTCNYYANRCEESMCDVSYCHRRRVQMLGGRNMFSLFAFQNVHFLDCSLAGTCMPLSASFLLHDGFFFLLFWTQNVDIEFCVPLLVYLCLYSWQFCHDHYSYSSVTERCGGKVGWVFCHVSRKSRVPISARLLVSPVVFLCFRLSPKTNVRTVRYIRSYPLPSHPTIRYLTGWFTT